MEWNPIKSFTLLGSSLWYKYKSRVVVSDSDLLTLRLGCFDCKIICSIGPWACVREDLLKMFLQEFLKQ